MGSLDNKNLAGSNNPVGTDAGKLLTQVQDEYIGKNETARNL